MSGHVDNPLRGIGLSLLAGIIFCVADTIAKKLATQMAIVQITWTRYIVFACMALLLTTQVRGSSFYTRAPKLQIARGMCLVCSSLLFILGIRDVGLAEAATIGFLGPIVVTFLSIILLGETVDWRRWLALAAGMLGVLIVLRPGTGAFRPEGLYRVASAMFWAGGVILTRKMTRTERSETTMFWSAISGLVMLSVIVPFHFAPPTRVQLLMSVGQGILSSLGQWLVILSLYSFMQLLWTTIAGFLAFGALPDQWTIVGAGVIVGSGLYTANRERRR